MDKEIIFLVEEDPEGGFTAKALDHGIFTEAESMEKLKAMTQDAVRCHFDKIHKPPIIQVTRGDIDTGDSSGINIVLSRHLS